MKKENFKVIKGTKPVIETVIEDKISNKIDDMEENNNLINARRFFLDKFDARYMSAMRKVFRSEIEEREPDLTKEELRALLKHHSGLDSYVVKDEELTREYEAYYKMFLNYVDNASRYYTRLAESSKFEYHEFQIVGVETVKDEVVQEHGEYVYQRALEEVPLMVVDEKTMEVQRDFKNASRKLCCLICSSSPKTPIIDLDIYCRYLQYKGIETRVDYETNTLFFGTPPVEENSNKALDYRLVAE